MTKHIGSILIVDDNADILTASRLLLKQHYQQVKTTTDPHQICHYLEQFDIDVVLLDMNFTQDAISGKEGFHWLQQILRLKPSTTVIMMTAYADLNLAIQAIKAGAADFIAKPWRNEALLAVVAAAFTHASTKRERDSLSRQNSGLTNALSGQTFPFLGESVAMQRVFSTIEKAAKTDANILILGESGTGKELAARAIHQASQRAEKAFVSVDMGSVSDSLFESELFGHKKGAFTDAKQDRVGRFELAHNGSIFLDEIGNLPLSQQAKLLAVLQNRQVTPIGSNKPIDFDSRLICATNHDLLEAIDTGEFRQDFLYRINTIEIQLPPLRDRVEDIPLLVQHYLTHFSQKYHRQLTITASDLNRLCLYTWPGNVRELAHSIERSVILSEGHQLDISAIISNTKTPSKSHDDVPPRVTSFNLLDVEKETVAAALQHFQGNVSKAAKALGLTRGALYRRLEKHEL
ncbi:sigma-54-dependent Fis family transcriptional regulator [Shewanella sp. KX20019]|uniref:sigma-54-dependent transcriptional regulator n=1 Tax=Shewanella sp. KX20019 TaxID=2803864 RepID=UPI001927202A|nr:sigma-54 dependent transcriptional regulator [Shewanella sp. KX20019]QQX80487.1 sigma-54-dependent Fis family transcriptional regulator [Shewanella sp. KX20019]